MKAKDITPIKRSNAEKLSDFTDDWPSDELRMAIEKGKKSADSNIKSAKDHKSFFGSSS